MYEQGLSDMNRANKSNLFAFRMQINIETSPNRLNNKFKVQMNRAPVKQLNIKPYTVCLVYKSRYPDFGKEFMGIDMNEKLAVTGQAQVCYYTGSSLNAIFGAGKNSH